MHSIHTLKNKLRLITVPIKGAKTATVLVMVRTGSKYENKKNNGISHFMEHMFFKGAKKRPNALAISSALDGMGADFNAFTAKEYTGYWIKTEAKQIESAMDIVSDMLLNSKFEQAEIEREKGVIIEELNMHRDNPMMYIEDLFEELLYGDQPAGWDTIGTKENILGFKQKDFIDYLTSQYGAQNIFVCLAGNIPTCHCEEWSGAKRNEMTKQSRRLQAVPHAQKVASTTGLLRRSFVAPRNDNIEKLVNKYFSNFQPSDFQDKQLVKEKQCKPRVKLHYKKTDQLHLSLGVRTFPIGHKDEFILKAASILLGGSMSSRLFTQLRERRGLAYYVMAQHEFYTDTGYLTARAGVPINKLEQAVKIILAEYKKLADKSVDKKELEKIKNLIRGKMAIQLEASDNIANWYGLSAVLRDKILTPENFLKAIDSVTAKDIQRVARDIFVNQGLNLAVIGPFRGGKRFEEILNI
ncbi:MAG: pitrilysin family protein [Patescibacteria group bacterium]|nr:pitrilysin family protein [Patescibacteria group bacterium]